MTKEGHGHAFRHVHTLFSVGTMAGLSDGQLLEWFATRGGESAEVAFAILVERHGPMVLRVCRGVLGDRDDAEDAFQATFLVLVRKAGTLWVRDSLSPWLHQVAYRVASCARSSAARRRGHERQAAGLVKASPCDGGRDDLGMVLHEEVQRLPERFRKPLVLCDLEGLTREQAARHLGWPSGTVQSRLARGRERLRLQLTRRGLAPSAMSLAAILSTDAKAAVPAALAGSTVRAAMTFAAGHSMNGVIPASVAALLEGGFMTTSLTRITTAAAFVLMLGAGAGGLAYQASNGSQDKPVPARTATPPPAEKHVPAPRAVPSDLEAKTKALEDKLDKPIVLIIPNETTLSAALVAIKKATAGPNDTGIPIYVDPLGLQEAGMTMGKPIQVELYEEATPLRKNLRQLLRPLGMDFLTQDGLLSISSRDICLDQKIWQLKEELRKVTDQLKAAERRAARATDGSRSRD